VAYPASSPNAAVSARIKSSRKRDQSPGSPRACASWM
jgi:hypothetical protein